MGKTGSQTQEMVCGMCGQRFNPDEHSACRRCPLAPGCQLVCCPTCGFESVNPQRSVLASNTLKISQALRGFGRSLQADHRQRHNG